MLARVWVALYRVSLRALPLSSRSGLEEEMCAVFEQALRHGTSSSFRVAGPAFGDLLRSVAREWCRLLPRTQLSRRRRRSEEKSMNTLAQDVRYALRLLGTQPGFVLVVVLTLALGIGANTAVFSVVHGVLLRPLPYQEPDRLALLWGHMSATEVTRAPWSGPDLVDFRERADSFEDLAAASGFNTTLTGDFEPEPIQLGWATANLFDLLGVQPLLGRSFVPSDQQNLDPALFAPDVNSPPPGVVMLSHELWERRFGADPGVLGRMVRVGGQPMEIVGVVPPDFRLYVPADAAMPSTVDLWGAVAFDLTKGPRDGQWLTVVGRLRNDVSLESARAEMSSIAAELRAENQFHANVGMEVEVLPMLEDVVGHTEPVLLSLLGAVGFVLLIACANVANLQLVRAQHRQRELCVRAALGGSRARLVRQMFIESALLAIAGGLAGLLLARVGIDLLLTLRPENLPRVEDVAIDTVVLAFVVGITFFSAFLFGILPALQSSRPDLAHALKDRTGGTAGGRGHWLRDALVVSEVALALVLLIGSGLMFRSFDELTKVELGFDPTNVLTVNVALPFLAYGGAEERVDFHHTLTEELRALPGVESVGALTPLPLGGQGQFWFGPYALHEANDEEWSRNEADYRIVLPGFLEAMGTPLVAGRPIEESDNRPDARRVVMVDQKMAATAWPGENPVGKRILVMRPNNQSEFLRYWAEVVGVVQSVRADDIRRAGRGAIYFPYMDWFYADMNYVVKASMEPARLTESIRSVIRELDPDVPAAAAVPLEGLVSDALAPTRFALVVMAIFAGVALLLSVVGLYGVLSYSVRQRTRELAVRIAFGAEKRRILETVIVRGLALTLTGVAVGLLVSFLVTRVLSALLFSVTPTDPLTFGVIAAVLTGVALFACYVPAARATEVDPLEALRVE